ncbi:MAG: translocation/assembly module TamB domain-containing protein, partial [Gemmatimonadaceae bacterium]
ARYIPQDSSTVFPRPGPTAEKLALARADSEKVAKRMMVARAAGVAPPATPIVIDTPAAFHRDTLAGTVKAEGTVTGSIASFDVKGTATGKNIIALGNTVESAKLKYTWNGVMGDSALADITASADSVGVAGFALDSVTAHITYNKPGGNARVAVFQNSQRDYALNAAYAIFPDRQEIHFDTLRFRFDTTLWASTHAGGISWGHPGVQIDTLELKNNVGGRIFANGKLPSDASADLQLAITKFEVGDLAGLLQSDLALRGLFSIDAHITGTGVAPIISGKANIENSTYGGTVVPDLKAKFDYAAERLTTEASATYADREVLKANGTVPINLATNGVTGSRLIDGDATADIKLDSLPLDLAARLTDAVSDVHGFAKGSAMLRGPIKKPKVTGDLVVGDAAVRIAAVGIKLDRMNGAVHVHNDSLTLDSLTAYSLGRIAVTGGMGIANIAAPSFDFKFDADGATLLDTRDLGKVRADADFTMKGPFDGVVVDGTARIREGVFYIPKPDTREQINERDPVVFAAGDTTNGRAVFVAPTMSPLMSNLKMNLRLSVDRDTWVRNKDANVEIYSDGDLRIDVD